MAQYSIQIYNSTIIFNVELKQLNIHNKIDHTKIIRENFVKIQFVLKFIVYSKFLKYHETCGVLSIINYWKIFLVITLI